MIARSWGVAVALAGLLVVAGCIRVNVIAHDPTAAALAANQFARLAFIDGDTAAAYGKMTAAAQAVTSEAQLVATLPQMHPRGKPVGFEPFRYAPIRGQALIGIALTGRGEEGSAETFLYQITMAGDAISGYKVNGFHRIADPGALGSWQPLPPFR